MPSSIKRGTTPQNKIRFRPGCYYQLGRGGSAAPASPVNDWATVTAATTGELATCKAMRGVQIRYGWAELEPTEGVYDFAELEGHLDDLKMSAADGGPRLLSVLLQCKTFVDTQHVVPSWMRNSTYGGGEILYAETDGGAADGYIVRFNHAAVQAKFQLLANALGAAFANNAQIELIGITEMNIPGIATGGTLTVNQAMTGHLEGGIICHGYLRTAFPYTMLRQILNYPKDRIATLITDYVDAGIGIGAADIFQDEIQLEETGSGLGIYDYMRTYGGTIPIVAEFQNKNFIYSNLPGRVNPTNGWAASCTVSDAGGGNTLLSSATINHGLSSSDTTEYLNIEGTRDALIKVNTSGGGWAAQNLTIVSVPTIKNIVVSYTYGGETAPTGLLDAGTPAYPLTNQTYVPSSNTHTGYVPTILQLVEFTRTEFPGVTHMIFTRLTSTSVLDGETHGLRVRKYINSTLAKLGKLGGCTSVRPTNIS